MRKEEKKEQKKATYEKPVLTKFKKLTDITANEVSGFDPILGCARF